MRVRRVPDELALCDLRSVRLLGNPLPEDLSNFVAVLPLSLIRRRKWRAISSKPRSPRSSAVRKRRNGARASVSGRGTSAKGVWRSRRRSPRRRSPRQRSPRRRSPPRRSPLRQSPRPRSPLRSRHQRRVQRPRQHRPQHRLCAHGSTVSSANGSTDICTPRGSILKSCTSITNEEEGRLISSNKGRVYSVMPTQ
jgi:hypothetical protein